MPPNIKFHHIYRGDQTWKVQQLGSTRLNILTGGLYDAPTHSFYFMENSDKGLLEYSINEQKLVVYKLVQSNGNNNIKKLPFLYEKHKLKNRMGLKLRKKSDDVLISTCGTFFHKNNVKVIFEYEKSMEPSIDEESDDDDKEGRASTSSKLKGVWIYPRFHQIPSNLTW